MSGIVNSAGSRSGVIGTTELDYEEGEFAFTVSASAGTFNINSGHNTGYYCKIGNFVHFHGQLGSTTDTTGNAYLTLNLPFVGHILTSEREVTAGGLVTYSVDYDGSGIPVYEIPGGGSTFVKFQMQSDAGGWSNFVMASGDYYLFSINYTTA